MLQQIKLGSKLFLVDEKAIIVKKNAYDCRLYTKEMQESHRQGKLNISSVPIVGKGMFGYMLKEGAIFPLPEKSTFLASYYSFDMKKLELFLEKLKKERKITLSVKRYEEITEKLQEDFVQRFGTAESGATDKAFDELFEALFNGK